MNRAIRPEPPSGGKGTGSPFYGTFQYCQCLEDFGTPVLLGEGICCALDRQVPGTCFRDVIYPYPMYAIMDEPGLIAALRSLPCGQAVTATFVTDPIAGVQPTPSQWDLARPWKSHLLVDNSINGACSFSSKIRYYSGRARSKFGVRCEIITGNRAGLLDRWLDLWSLLVARHGLVGLKALSSGYFRRLFDLEGVLLAVLSSGEGIHSIHIWILDGDRSYSHLHASDEYAYAASGNYLLYSSTLSWLKDSGYRISLLGSSPGSGSNDGLFRFKRQFANSSASNHLLGLIIDREAYLELTGSSSYAGGYFPSYREGELL